MKLLFPIFVYFLLIFNFSNCQENGRDEKCIDDSGIVEQISANAQSQKSPILKHGTNVSVSIWIQDIRSLDAVNGQVNLVIYVNEVWHDPALKFDHLHPCNHNVTTNGEIFSKIWSPKMVFINSVRAKMVESTDNEEFVLIYPNGTIWRNRRVDITAPCEMDFGNYPKDTQICRLIYSSVRDNVQKANVIWDSYDILLIKSGNLANYDLTKFTTRRDTLSYPAGKFVELNLDLEFRRKSGALVKYVYMPSFILVMLSWITFCLGSAVTARVVVGCTTLLGLLIIYLSASRDLPPVSYLTNLDTWMLTCICFVFVSLLEVAFVTVVSRYTKQKSTRDQVENESSSRLISRPKERMTKKYITTSLDVIFAVIFPVTFAIFVLVYTTRS